MTLAPHVSVLGVRIPHAPYVRRGYSLLIGKDTSVHVERYGAWWRSELVLLTPRNWTDTLSIKSCGHKSAPAAARALGRLITRWGLEGEIRGRPGCRERGRPHVRPA